MKFWEERQILVSSGTAFLVNIILWIAVLGKFGLAGETVPLHYSIVFGIDLIGSSWRLYELPAAGLIILFINLWIASLLYDRQRLFSYFFTYTALCVQLLLGIALAAIIF